MNRHQDECYSNTPGLHVRDLRELEDSFSPTLSCHCRDSVLDSTQQLLLRPVLSRHPNHWRWDRGDPALFTVPTLLQVAPPVPVSLQLRLRWVNAAHWTSTRAILSAPSALIWLSWRLPILQRKRPFCTCPGVVSSPFPSPPLPIKFHHFQLNQNNKNDSKSFCLTL